MVQDVDRPASRFHRLPRPRKRPKARTGLRAWLLYALVRMVFAVMQIFPIDWNLRSARIFARIWPRLIPRHRRRAIDHLTESLGDELSPGEIERIADHCLESTAMFAVEAVCLPRLIGSSGWNRYVSLVGYDEALAAMVQGRGAILVSGHYGSFEVMGHVLGILGHDVVAIMRPLDNAYLNRFLVKSRRMNGLTVLNKKGAMDQAVKVLEDGRLLALIGDQDAGRKGLFVDFFGRPASTYKSIGLLAMTQQCPIVVGYTRRLGNRARYEFGVQRVIHPHEWEDRDDPLRWITQTYTTAIEEITRVEPEQYLWIHRRWKSKPRVRRRAVAPANV